MSINRNNTPPAAPDSIPLADAHAQAHLAHELANLLDGSLRNVALVMSQLREFQGHGPSQEATPALIARLDAANDAMRQMAHLIAQLLNRGPSQDQPRPGFLLGDAAGQAVRLYSSQAQQLGVTLEEKLDPAARLLPAGTLFPVLVNLIRNSLQALAEAPATGSAARSIRLSATVDQDHLVLVVEDDGPGFAAELFDGSGAFRYGVTTRSAGHGLGLTLVRDIIHTLGGSLQIASRPDKAQPTSTQPAAAGARVRVRMPVNRLDEIVT